MTVGVRRAALAARRLGLGVTLPGSSWLIASAAGLRTARVQRSLTSGTAYSAVVVGVPTETHAGEAVRAPPHP